MTEEKIKELTEELELYENRWAEIQRGVAINRNLILYCTVSGELMVKVTDYNKGYWAETPLNTEEMRRLWQALSSAHSVFEHRYKTERELEDLKAELKRKEALT